MKKHLVIAIALLILLTTINSQQKIAISKFNLKEIIIENNLLLKDKDIINFCCELKVVNNINRNRAITRRFFIY